MGRADEDDLLEELPPLDGEGEEGDGAPPELDAVVPEAKIDDPFDDATGEADPVDEVVSAGEAEHGLLLDTHEADTLNLGEFDMVGSEGVDLLADLEEPGVDGEDFGFVEGASAADLDGGEEGPTQADETLREEDLPRMDADENTEGEDALERWFAQPDDEDAIPAWDDLAWERADEPLTPPWSSGPLWAGGTFESLSVEPNGTVWVLTRGAEGKLERRRGGPDVLSNLVLPESAQAHAEDELTCVAQAGVVVAIGAMRRLVRWSTHGGRTTTIDGTARASAVAFADGGSTLLIAIRSAADDRAWLAKADETGKASIVAEIGGGSDGDEEVRITTVFWDAERKGAWVAGPFGVALLLRKDRRSDSSD